MFRPFQQANVDALEELPQAPETSAEELLAVEADEAQALLSPDSVHSDQADAERLAVAERWLRDMQYQRQLTVEARPEQRSGSRAEFLSAAGAVPARHGAHSADVPLMFAAQSAESMGARALAETAPSSQSGGVPHTPSPAAAMGAEMATTGPAAASQSGSPAVLEQTLRLESPEAKWGEQMLHALRKSVEMQLQQRVQSATLRLDPPELGSLEIHVSHESGRLSVQILAAQGDVARLLHQTSERLRQELVEERFVHVDVQVSSDGQQRRQGGSRQYQRLLGSDELIVANVHSVSSAESTRASGARSDVLVTV